MLHGIYEPRDCLIQKDDHNALLQHFIIFSLQGCNLFCFKLCFKKNWRFQLVFTSPLIISKPPDFSSSEIQWPVLHITIHKSEFLQHLDLHRFWFLQKLFLTCMFPAYKMITFLHYRTSFFSAVEQQMVNWRRCREKCARSDHTLLEQSFLQKWQE